MTTKDIFRTAILLGVRYDLRGDEAVKEYLDRQKKKFSKLNDWEKEAFDQEKLSNPYSDSRILVDHGKAAITKLAAGIDMGGAELMLAEKLGADLAIVHHPSGKAFADLAGVMDMQADIFANYGVPINVAESLLKERSAEIERKIAGANHNQAVDMARLLGLDFMCAHTTADNLAANFMVNLLERKQPRYVEDIFTILHSIPEYQEHIKVNAGPKLFMGDKENRVGKIAVEFTGGTNPNKEIYEKMGQAGIGTVVSMHMSEEHRQEAKKHHINVVIAGHMSSDSLGMNLFLDEVEKQGVTVVPMGGLVRVKRY